VNPPVVCGQCWDAELGEDVPDVRFGGLRADVEPLGDAPVGEAFAISASTSRSRAVSSPKGTFSRRAGTGGVVRWATRGAEVSVVLPTKRDICALSLLWLSL